MKTKYTLSVLLSLMANLFLVAQTDQTLQWASFFGGEDPSGFSLTIPSTAVLTQDGGMIACGLTTSSSGIVFPPAHQSAMLGSSAGFFIKTDANHNVEYASYFGGEGDDDIADIAIMSDGGFVIGGGTTSSEAIATPNSFMTVKPEGQSGFLARFNSEGQLIWSTYLGGDAPIESQGNYIREVAVDQDDNIYCIGVTVSVNFPVTEGALQSEHSGGLDGFIAKFTPDGVPEFITYIGGSGADNLVSLNLTQNDGILIGGTTNSDDYITTQGSFQTDISGGTDVFIAQLDVNVDLVWSTYFGGNQNEVLFKSLAEDSEGNFFIMMASKSASMETLGVSFEEIGYEEQRLVAKFSSNGFLSWSRYLPYWPLDAASGLTYCEDNLIVFGTARAGFSAMALGNPYQPEVNPIDDQADIFIQGISNVGQPVWGTYYGGSQFDIPSDIICYLDNQILISASTSSTDIEISTDAFQSELSSEANALFAIFEVSSLTGLADDEQLQMGVFPNPSSGRVWLELPAEFSFTADVTVQSISGQLLSRHERFNTHEPLNLPETPGMYIITARNGEAIARARVLVY